MLHAERAERIAGWRVMSEENLRAIIARLDERYRRAAACGARIEELAALAAQQRPLLALARLYRARADMHAGMIASSLDSGWPAAPWEEDVEGYAIAAGRLQLCGNALCHPAPAVDGNGERAVSLAFLRSMFEHMEHRFVCAELAHACRSIGDDDADAIEIIAGQVVELTAVAWVEAERRWRRDCHASSTCLH